MVKAVNGVDLDIERGEYVAIVGSSGSGKSTLMSILGRISKPTSGNYTLNGTNVEDMSDDELSVVRNKNIGFVFQSFQLLPRSSAVKNVALPLVYRDVAQKVRNERAQKALDIVGLGERYGHRPNQLSGGQRQRVAVARALVTEPALILADEPTGNLDSATAKEILKLFTSLHEQGNTIVIVTHEPKIDAECPRSIRMEDGRIVSDTKSATKPKGRSAL